MQSRSQSEDSSSSLLHVLFVIILLPWTEALTGLQITLTLSKQDFTNLLSRQPASVCTGQDYFL